MSSEKALAEARRSLPEDWLGPGGSDEEWYEEEESNVQSVRALTKAFDPNPYVRRIPPLDYCWPLVLLNAIFEDVVVSRPDWWNEFRELMWRDRMAVIDAALNRQRRPEAWMFRIGILCACEEGDIDPPEWPPVAWPINDVVDEATGDTLLHKMLAVGCEAATQLVRYGADPNQKNFAGRTALHVAVGLEKRYRDRKEDHSIHLYLLLKHGARWDVRDNQNLTPLDAALNVENYADAVDLIDVGARSYAIREHCGPLISRAKKVNLLLTLAFLEEQMLEAAALAPPKKALDRRRPRL